MTEKLAPLQNTVPKQASVKVQIWTYIHLQTQRAPLHWKAKSKYVSKLVFYAQSTGAVISGWYTSHILYLIFNNVYVLKWVYIQF